MKLLLTAIILLPLFASSQYLDTVKIKALIPSYMVPWHAFPISATDSSGIEGTAIIVRGYAVYEPFFWSPIVSFGGSVYCNGLSFYHPRTLRNLLYPNKRDTLKNVYDYKEINW